MSFLSGSSALFSARQLSALLEAEKQSFHRVSGPAIPGVEPEAEGNEKANSVIRKCVRGTHHYKRYAMENHSALTKNVVYHPVLQMTALKLREVT